MPDNFDQSHLRSLGFEGFRPLRALVAAHVPYGPGIYAVLLDPPEGLFLERSVGGNFKGKDPTVPTDRLEQKWVANTPTMYIGRGGDLQARITLLTRYGRGEPVGHQGGRYLWQLKEHWRLLVAWRREHDPVSAEAELLSEFERAFGRLPFANLVRGARPAVLA